MFHKEFTSDPDIGTTLKKWSESGKERMFSKHRTVFPMFLNGGRSSMLFILRFFDVFPRETGTSEIVSYVTCSGERACPTF